MGAVVEKIYLWALVVGSPARVSGVRKGYED